MTRGIEGKVIFPDEDYYQRFIDMIDYYRFDQDLRYSHYLRLEEIVENKKEKELTPIIDVIAYVLMPNHIHLLVDELEPGALSRFCKRLLDSYTRYFNLKNSRKGTLYQGNAKTIPVDKGEYLLHLSRYIHLNPYSAGLVTRPEEWNYSSYPEYLGIKKGFCATYKYMDIKRDTYKQFVENQKDYQRTLEILKAHLKRAGLI